MQTRTLVLWVVVGLAISCAASVLAQDLPPGLPPPVEPPPVPPVPGTSEAKANEVLNLPRSANKKKETAPFALPLGGADDPSGVPSPTPSQAPKPLPTMAGDGGPLVHQTQAATSKKEPGLPPVPPTSASYHDSTTVVNDGPPPPPPPIPVGPSGVGDSTRPEPLMPSPAGVQGSTTSSRPGEKQLESGTAKEPKDLPQIPNDATDILVRDQQTFPKQAPVNTPPVPPSTQSILEKVSANSRDMKKTYPEKSHFTRKPKAFVLVGQYKHREEPASEGKQKSSPDDVTKSVAASSTHGKGAANLAVIKKGPPKVQLGEEITYEISLANRGTASAANVQLEDLVPPGAVFVASDPVGMVMVGRKPGESVNSGPTKVVWNVKLLPAGSQRKYKVVIRPTNPGKLPLATVALIRYVGQTETLVTGKPLHCALSTDSKIVGTGQPVNLKLLLVNNTKAVLGKLSVRLALSGGIVHPKGKIIKATLAALPAGTRKVFDIQLYAAQPGLGKVVVSDQPEGGQVATDEMTVEIHEVSQHVAKRTTVPQFAIGKTGPTPMYLGEISEYKLDLINKGNLPIRQLKLMEHLPIGVEYVSASDRATYDPATRTIRWDLGPIPARRTKRVVVRLRATQEGTVINRVTAEQPGGLTKLLTAKIPLRYRSHPQGPELRYQIQAGR
ncbi:MAG: hypothetical protein ACFCD0_07530 [Gemmataceae bacterium]